MYLTELFRLNEINVGNVTHGNADQYYGYSMNGNLHTHPAKSLDSHFGSLPKDWRDDKDEKFKQNYSNVAMQPSHFLVDNNNKTVNLNTDISNERQSRRKKMKVARPTSNNWNDEEDEYYPILDSSVSFERIVDLIKNLKALVKADPRTSNYTVVGDDRIPDNTSVNDIISNKVSLAKHTDLYDNQKDFIVMYHGTSVKRAKIILEQGLRPNKRGEKYGDLMDNYSEYNATEAANYATREAINDSSNPVILKVLVKKTDYEKLKPDEDSMSLLQYLPKNVLDRFYRNNPLLQQLKMDDFHIGNLDHKNKTVDIGFRLEYNKYWPEAHKEAKKLFKQYGLTTPEKIREYEHKLYNEIMKMFVGSSFDRSFKKMGTIAYKGIIPSKFISMFKTWKIKGTDYDNSQSKDYGKFYDKQKSTKQYFNK